ncbi:MAG: rhodanese-like domain-containing protein [Halanaerobiales bacterium]|nr:rhodanese-like domain-containing protein [Halanaerobiales bacterium]
MKRKIILPLFLLLVVMSVCTVVGAVSSTVEDAVMNYFANLPADNSMIKQDLFVEKVKAGEELFILDIRQPDVYNQGHVKGAINLPWGPTAIAESLEQLPTDQTIYVYCYTAQTANQTVALLNFAGFEAKSVRFGWNLGISRVSGYEDIVETKQNKLAGGSTAVVEPEIKTALVEYYAGLADVKDTMFKNYKISEDILNMLVENEDDDIMILSVRQAKDFAKGHIAGASNIPWGKGMQEYFDQLPLDKKIVVYCYTGQTAGQVVAGLRLLGYDAVSLNGGMGTAGNKPYGWANKGYEVVQ